MARFILSYGNSPKNVSHCLSIEFAGLERNCKLEAVHRGRQMIEDGSLQLYFSTWPSFPSILVILPLTVDCGDHEYMQPQPWPLSFPSLAFPPLLLQRCRISLLALPVWPHSALAPDSVSGEKASEGQSSLV